MRKGTPHLKRRLLCLRLSDISRFIGSALHERCFRVTSHGRTFQIVPVRKLTATQIKSQLAELPSWRRKGAAIVRTLEFIDFPAAIKHVHRVARIAEKANHHPDIDIRWNKVTFTLTTHDSGGLTVKDFEVARQIDAIA